MSLRAWLLRALALLGAIAMPQYGIPAIDAGIVNVRAAGSAEVMHKRQATQARAESEARIGATDEVAAHSGRFFALRSHTNSPMHAFGDRGLRETLIHRATMPRFDGIMLSIYHVLGGITMLFGALQFWPALRRRLPK